MPNRNHDYASEAFIIRRCWDFLVRNLLGTEAPAICWLDRPAHQTGATTDWRSCELAR
jgi:hypothetical protein